MVSLPDDLLRAADIEALMLCHFLAMLTEALIEREIRTSTQTMSLMSLTAEN